MAGSGANEFHTGKSVIVVVSSPQLIEIPILQYKFHLRPLTWLEEFSIVYPKGKNPQKVMLAYAMIDVSNVPVKTVEEGLRVLDPIPTPILSRMYKIYRGSLRPARKFEAAPLYKAPEPSSYSRRVRVQASEQEAQMENVDRHLENVFGAKELAEARALEQQILKASLDDTGKPRGAVRASEDPESAPARSAVHKSRPVTGKEVAPDANQPKRERERIS